MTFRRISFGDPVQRCDDECAHLTPKRPRSTASLTTRSIRPTTYTTALDAPAEIASSFNALHIVSKSLCNSRLPTQSGRSGIEWHLMKTRPSWSLNVQYSSEMVFGSRGPLRRARVSQACRSKDEL